MRHNQAEKLKSHKMKEGWMKTVKDEWRMMKVEGLKNDDCRLLRGFEDWKTNGLMDICDCRVAFATEHQWLFYN